MPPKKEAPKKNHFAEVLLILFGLYFLWMIFNRFQAYLRYIGSGSVNSIWGRVIGFFIRHVVPVVEFLGVVVVVLAVCGIVYSLSKLKKIVAEEKAIYSPEAVSSDVLDKMPEKNAKWERVISHINSTNIADWKLAILEADIMLDDLLTAAGYRGESLGEMLKSVEKSDFTTIEAAWEAHKIRNQIAHQGGDFNLNEREAKRVIALYESVFKEFKII